METSMNTIPGDNLGWAPGGQYERKQRAGSPAFQVPLLSPGCPSRLAQPEAAGLTGLDQAPWAAQSCTMLPADLPNKTLSKGPARLSHQLPQLGNGGVASPPVGLSSNPMTQSCLSISVTSLPEAKYNPAFPGSQKFQSDGHAQGQSAKERLPRPAHSQK